MATMEEVSARLMQPAKDLSDWNYPLAKDLEKYSTAVVETEDISFSNAGLVVQNAANIYVRRIEYLFQDTIIMAQSLTDHETAEEAVKNPKKDGKSRKIVVDFGDFEPIDFAQYVGKNNNMKAQTGTRNSVKLLSQRFPQLENVSRSPLPIEVYDVHGEVVGKKYDFRCNQYLTASGMLVEHLTPEDFPDHPPVDDDTNVQPKSPDHRVTLSSVTEQHCDSGNEDDAEVHESFSGLENRDASVTVQDKDTDILDTSFASYADSGLGTSILSPDTTARPESSLSCDNEPRWESSRSRAGSSLSVGDINSLGEKGSEPSSSSPTDSGISDSTSTQTTTEKTDVSSQCDSSIDCRNVVENEATVAHPDSGDKEEDEVFVRQNRRSKRIKNVIDAVNDLNPKLWEPIPFNGAPDKTPKSRAEFKLPCTISAVKFKERLRKRKVSSGKKRSMASSLINESESARKKMTMYSPTRQLFLPFKKESFEDFQKNFELHYKNRSSVDPLRYEAVRTASKDLLGYRTNFSKSDRETAVCSSIDELVRSDSDHDPFNYEAVANISEDLLGFKTNVSKSDSLNHEETSRTEPVETNEGVDSSIDDFSTSEPIDNPNDFSMSEPIDNTHDFSMPDTPVSSGSSERLISLEPLPSYHSRIERSVREIYESSDVRTAQEEAVARWHEHMKPKLQELELRPPFDMSHYSARLIQNLRSIENRRIDFKEMVRQKMVKPTEIARYFLASLQLANTYNVHIDTGHDVERNLTLVLLDKGRSGSK